MSGRISLTGLIQLVAAGLNLFCWHSVSAQQADGKADARPNIVFILADDLGFAELGCYGQTRIRTPEIDRLAAQGMRFTQFYAGAPVCAPSRCTLMTGKHLGHAAIRDNSEVQPEGQKPLPASETTLATLLKQQGYVTGCFGKWGLGGPDSEGEPRQHGFDEFYGYLCQRHAHNHYPAYLRQHSTRVELPGNSTGLTGQLFTHDLFEQHALEFIRSHQKEPFFLYVPFTVPHVALQVPEDSLAEYAGLFPDAPYDGKKGYLKHPQPHAAYAAMVTRLDRSVGRIVTLLDELKLDRRTLVCFSSDNGPVHDGIGGADSEFFASAAGLRGLKGSVFEGGIRTPFIARWTGTITPGTVSDHVAYFPDVLPTLMEVVGATDRTPGNLDGISLVPVLKGNIQRQTTHSSLVWTFPGYGGQVAIRSGDWKGVRQTLIKNPDSPWMLFDLKSDPKEQRDVAAEHPEIVAQMNAILKDQYRPNPVFPIPALENNAVK